MKEKVYARKKEKQWKIDRAFKISFDNECRLKNILTCIQPVKFGNRSKDEAIEEARRLGVLAIRDGDNQRGREGYEQSTATLPRSYGLIGKDAYETTEVSDKYLAGEITFSELIILQLLKKEFIYDDDMTAEVLHPMAVALKVLLKIREIDKNQAWIDSYDYFYFLTEIKNLTEIDDCALKIIESHKDVDRNNKYKINDFDMWAGAFETTGLFKAQARENGEQRTIRYSLNETKMGFIEWVATVQLENIGTSKSRRTEEEQRRFGMLDSSIVSQIPKLVIDKNLEYPINGISSEREVLEAYLFESLSYRDIEKSVFGENVDANGWMAKAILASYGFEVANSKGVFTPFKDHKNLVKLSMENQKDTRVYKILFTENIETEEIQVSDDFLKPIEGRSANGYNKIYYGIPGCGKSYKVSNEVLSGVSSENIFRTTFFLDYTNSDFVGQLVPKTDKDKHVTYEPNFGPFSKALKRACETTDMVYLVIEEINRGNAAAIFGDLFQLLDRLDAQKVSKRNDGSVVGDSEYPITNNFIEDYLHFEPGKVIIPSNLTIIATMNTSDQNVFPLDTAFKRRWDRECVIPNWKDAEVADLCIPYTDTTWRHFVDEINQCMTSEEANGTISEDKKIGPYFVDQSVLTAREARHDNTLENKEKLRKFVNNVVDYLYNDVTKFDHELMFAEKHSYESVYSSLIEISVNPNPMRGPLKFMEIFAKKITSDVATDSMESNVNETGNNTEDTTSGEI